MFKCYCYDIQVLLLSLCWLSACQPVVTDRVPKPAAVLEKAASLAPDVNQSKAATASTRQVQAYMRTQMPLNIEKEKNFARRGFIATLPSTLIKKQSGETSFNLAANDFLEGMSPDTVNPLLWQQGEFMALSEGLFKVTDGVYQVRGFDVANISFIETDNGYIVVDPLTAAEPARAAYELVKTHIGDKPVVAVIYTHSHTDHFAGISGVVDIEAAMAGRVPIIAPAGFMAETAKEWMIAGNAMGRRAFYQFGLFLEAGARGRVGVGQGPGIALGTHHLVPPTRSVTQTGMTLNLDGLEVIFQLAPEAEAPVEMNFYIPKYKALCMAETVNMGIHNVQTLRGAPVRDAKAWADHLTEALALFGEDAQSLFISHHWPRFGNQEIRTYVGLQRDSYKFIHDQTVRMMNQGLTPDEIAENFTLPERLSSQWYNRGFYGTLSHNVKAVYDKYMGWYNGIPADLNRHPPVARAQRYVTAMGGMAGILAQAGAAFDRGDYRWSAELLQHAVFARADHKLARALLADSYEQMGYQAESAIWRNIYLQATRELRQGRADVYNGGQEDYLLGGASDAQLLDLLSVRLLPERAADKSLSINVKFRESGAVFHLSMNNSVLVFHKDRRDPQAGLVQVSRRGFLGVALGFMSLSQAQHLDMVDVEGDGSDLEKLGRMMDKPSLDFNIIEP